MSIVRRIAFVAALLQAFQSWPRRIRLLREIKVIKRPRLELRGWKTIEQPGVDLFDRDKLFDLMNGR